MLRQALINDQIKQRSWNIWYYPNMTDLSGQNTHCTQRSANPMTNYHIVRPCPPVHKSPWSLSLRRVKSYNLLWPRLSHASAVLYVFFNAIYRAANAGSRKYVMDRVCFEFSSSESCIRIDCGCRKLLCLSLYGKCGENNHSPYRWRR